MEKMTQAQLEAAAMLMDDEIREEIHERGVTDPDEFLAAYIEKHFEKFGEKFVWQ